MKDISIIKPNMASVGQGQLGLSPFCALSVMMGQQIAQRSAQRMGAYRPISLTLLEEEEGEETQPNVDIHVDMDLKLLIDELKKQSKDEERTVEKRILEKVILREKEKQTLLIAPTGQTALPPQISREAVTGENTANAQITSNTSAEKSAKYIEALEQENKVLRAKRSPQERKSAKDAAHLLAEAAEAAARHSMTPLSQMTTVAQGGGWTAKHQSLHPGFPVQGEQTPSGETGSILLPDVMRSRREAALRRQQEQVEEPFLTAAEEMGLEAQALQSIRRAVERTLAKEYAPEQTGLVYRAEEGREEAQPRQEAVRPSQQERRRQPAAPLGQADRQQVTAGETVQPHNSTSQMEAARQGLPTESGERPAADPLHFRQEASEEAEEGLETTHKAKKAEENRTASSAERTVRENRFTEKTPHGEAVQATRSGALSGAAPTKEGLPAEGGAGLTAADMVHRGDEAEDRETRERLHGEPSQQPTQSAPETAQGVPATERETPPQAGLVYRAEETGEDASQPRAEAQRSQTATAQQGQQAAQSEAPQQNAPTAGATGVMDQSTQAQEAVRQGLPAQRGEALAAEELHFRPENAPTEGSAAESARQGLPTQQSETLTAEEVTERSMQESPEHGVRQGTELSVKGNGFAESATALAAESEDRPREGVPVQSEGPLSDTALVYRTEEAGEDASQPRAEAQRSQTATAQQGQQTAQSEAPQQNAPTAGATGVMDRSTQVQETVRQGVPTEAKERLAAEELHFRAEDAPTEGSATESVRQGLPTQSEGQRSDTALVYRAEETGEDASQPRTEAQRSQTATAQQGQQTAQSEAQQQNAPTAEATGMMDQSTQAQEAVRQGLPTEAKDRLAAEELHFRAEDAPAEGSAATKSVRQGLPTQSEGQRSDTALVYRAEEAGEDASQPRAEAQRSQRATAQQGQQAAQSEAPQQNAPTAGATGVMDQSTQAQEAVRQGLPTQQSETLTAEEVTERSMQESPENGVRQGVELSVKGNDFAEGVAVFAAESEDRPREGLPAQSEGQSSDTALVYRAEETGEDASQPRTEAQRSQTATAQQGQRSAQSEAQQQNAPTAEATGVMDRSTQVQETVRQGLPAETKERLADEELHFRAENAPTEGSASLENPRQGVPTETKERLADEELHFRAENAPTEGSATESVRQGLPTQSGGQRSDTALVYRAEETGEDASQPRTEAQRSQTTTIQQGQQAAQSEAPQQNATTAEATGMMVQSTQAQEAVRQGVPTERGEALADEELHFRAENAPTEGSAAESVRQGVPTEAKDHLAAEELHFRAKNAPTEGSATESVRQGLPTQSEGQRSDTALVYRAEETGEDASQPRTEAQRSQSATAQEGQRTAQSEAPQQNAPTAGVTGVMDRSTQVQETVRQGVPTERGEALADEELHFRAEDAPAEGSAAESARQALRAQRRPAERGAESAAAKGPVTSAIQAKKSSVNQKHLTDNPPDAQGREADGEAAPPEAIPATRETPPADTALVYRAEEQDEGQTAAERTLPKTATRETEKALGKAQAAQAIPAAPERTLPHITPLTLRQENGAEPPLAARPLTTRRPPMAEQTDIRLAAPKRPKGQQSVVAIPAAKAGQMPMEELKLAQMPPQREEPPKAEKPKALPKSDYIKSLPQWAQDLLEKPSEPGGPAQTGFQSPQLSPQGAAPSGQIQWTAPYALPQSQGQTAAPVHNVMDRPAQVSYVEKSRDEQQAAQPLMSDAEVRRTADKVYRIIEERLRRELRRGGR